MASPDAARGGGAPEDALPQDLAQTLQAWRESRIILTAVELDLFTAVGEGATPAAVAARLGTDPRATDFLLHALAALGLVEKHGESFRNAAAAARFLCAGAPDDRRGALLHTAALWHRWSSLTECVRTGRPAPRSERVPADTEAFIAAMHANATQRAPALVAALDLSGVRRVLDVGGGSGGYAIALARAVGGLHVEVLDLADVVPLAARYVAAAGLSDRVTTRVGDLSADDLGSGFDLVLLSAVCHMLGPTQNADLVRRAAAALGPGGRLVVQDFVLAPDRTAPRASALFAINMLVNTPAGGTYTEAEYLGWMKEAGLVDARHIPLPGPTGLLVGRKR
jgi:SAM-dependent methyltransferase